MSTIDITPLRAAVAGPVTLPGDPGWDDARRAWNLAVDQRPAAVVAAEGPDDVAAALAFARAAGLRVAPQGTGHGAAAHAALDGALLLKTGRMSEIAVDPVARRVRVGAGALWGDVAVAAGEHGLAVLHGASVDVGVVGYALCGGIGWLARLHGLTSSSVTAIELVTAEGERRRVDGDDDLFWALRGGGGSFAVVTAMELEAFPHPEVYAGTLLWPGEAAADALHAYRAWARETPDELTSTIRLLRLPPLPQVPEPLRDVPVVDVCIAHAGDPAEGAALARRLRDTVGHAPMIDTLATVPAPQLATLHGDPEQPVPAIGDHALLRELTPAGVEALVEAAGPASGSPLLAAELRQLGGALARPPAGAGALATLDGDYALFCVGTPMAPGAAEAVRARLDDVVAAMAPWSSGRAYLNFADRPTDVADAFDAATLARLRAVKRAADPDGLLLANHPVAAA